MSSNSDDILITALRQTGAELPADAASVKDLDSAAIFAACARCLNVIAQAKGEETR